MPGTDKSPRLETEFLWPMFLPSFFGIGVEHFADNEPCALDHGLQSEVGQEEHEAKAECFE